MKKNFGTISRIWPMKGMDPINHGLFANDSLLLGGASLRIARVFNELLQRFYNISRVLFNKIKIAVYDWNIDQQIVLRIAHFLCFSGFAFWDKIKYLGLPLKLGSNRPSLWIEVIIKIKPKIATCKGKWLNNVGNLTLIKSVLSSLLIYEASFNLAPKTIMEQVLKLFKDFLCLG